jgi:probable selenium-dependent hydroxylase accessory protein YqeC
VILDAFDLRERRYVHLVGGGGKTTLMFALAHALAAEGRTVLTTTTTRMMYPEPGESDHVVTGTDAAPLAERLRGELAAHRHVTVVAPDPAGGRKATGLPVAVLDALVDARLAAHVLVEADGSAGRSLKAHSEHEPVISPHADLVIAVVGVDCLGQPLDDAHVHRPALLCARLGRSPGAPVTPDDVAGIVLHPDGYLARVGKGARVVVFLNKAGTPGALERARGLARTLAAADREGRIGGIVVGDAKSGCFEAGAHGRGGAA